MMLRRWETVAIGPLGDEFRLGVYWTAGSAKRGGDRIATWAEAYPALTEGYRFVARRRVAA